MNIRPISIVQGSTFLLGLRLKAGTPATAMNLAGYGARLSVRGCPSDTTPLIDLTVANERVVIGPSETPIYGITPAQGEIWFVISAADTAALPAMGGVYDAEIVQPNGLVIKPVGGQVTIGAEATK